MKNQQYRHTIGPWKWTNYTLSGPNGRIICNAAEVGRDIPGDNEDHCNQRLLSNCPEMLSAIASILQCPTYAIGENLHPDFLSALNKAARVYVRATGMDVVQFSEDQERRSIAIDDAINEENYGLSKVKGT